MNLNQVCICIGHTNEPIIGYCLSSECQDYSQYCSQCILEKHQSHKKDCKSITQMIMLINEHQVIAAELSKCLFNDINSKQKEYHDIIKFLQFQKDSMEKLDEQLKNQEFEQLTIHCKILKEIYKFKKYQQEKNQDNNMPGDLLKQLYMLQEACNQFEKSLSNHQKQNENKSSPEKKIMEVEDNINNESDKKVEEIPLDQCQQVIINNPQKLKNFFNCRNLLFMHKEGSKSEINIDPDFEVARQKKKQCMILPNNYSKQLGNHLNNFKFIQGPINQQQISNSVEHFQLPFNKEIYFFYCKPDIQENMFGYQTIKAQMHRRNLFIGVCYKKMARGVINNIKQKNDTHGYFLIEVFDKNYRQMYQKGQGWNWADSQTTIEVQIDRIKNIFLLSMPEFQQRFEKKIPEIGIFKLCIGFQFGKIELIQE